MTKAKTFAAAAGAVDELAEPNPNALSAALKKSHAARSDAMFLSDALSKHIAREAERGGMDRMMVFVALIGAMAHELNPGAPLPQTQPRNSTACDRTAAALCP